MQIFLIDFNSKSTFAKQAQYQYAVLCFDKSDQLDLTDQEYRNLSQNAFQQLETLEKSLAKDSLFYVCANYNLGLATFNGKNKKVKSYDLLETASQYWKKAAGGDEIDLANPKGVKAMDIFCKGPSSTLSYSSCFKISVNNFNKNFPSFSIIVYDSELQFYRSLAQSRLGQLYSFDSNLQDYKQSFFWHTEAASNGNLESQGTIGVMYLQGIGCKKNEKSGVYCLKNAAAKNNTYALGRLVEYYYKKKIYGHCIESAKNFTIKFLLDSEDNIKEEIIKQANSNHCEPAYALKGAVLCAFYFARCYESGLVEKMGNQSQNLPTTEARKSLKFEQNESDNIMRIVEKFVFRCKSN